MPFAPHIARVLEAYGISPDTKAALYDLYVSMGDDVLEVFAEVAEGSSSTAQLTPDATGVIRNRVVERYLRRNHPLWLSGTPTPSLWHPRELEGRASGLARPLGDVPESVRGVVPPGQRAPEGLVILGRNAHYGGRQETISFDVVPPDLDDAVDVALSLGQQHTIPGSVGETSGTFDARRGIALVWEVQPNVYKPAGDRNRAIAKVYRRHRNWHLVTLGIALAWLQAQNGAVFILRGDALAPTHEVNPAKPVSPEIASNHDRTVRDVCERLGLRLEEVSYDDEFLLLESIVMNHALRRHVLREGAAGAMWKVVS